MSEGFDVVIVGAGSAGCVLAGRLSQDPNRRVLLIEAGPDGSAPSIDGDSVFAALTEPGRTHAGVDVVRAGGSDPSAYLLGRGIGGSSSVNAMIGSWGLPSDYDRWERDLGCPGWSWRDVAPVFASIAIPLEQPTVQEWGDVDRALVEAARLLGHPVTEDPLSTGALGVGPAWLTRRGRRRISASDAYLEPARSRPNLVVRTDSHAARIVLDGTRAVGVQFADGEIVEGAEVVLSAGAIHSPELLLRSGVARSGIGAGLKDHPSASFTLRLREPADTTGLAASTLLRWSSVGGHGDLQLLPLNHVGVSGYGSLVAGLMAVESSGSLHLDGDRTVIRFETLSDERDRLRLREAARHVAVVAATEPFRRIADAVFIDDRGTPAGALVDDASFDAWLATSVGNYVHASSTCRMGAADDPTSVVDTQGRVHGYTGLRVCDAGIFPDIPTGNPHLPTVMVAERIAAIMGAAWRSDASARR